MSRVLVCGGRHFSDWYRLNASLDRLHGERGFAELIHGAAPGADTLAEAWASIAGVPTRRFIARWHSEGAKAGPLRNQRMIDEGKPDLVIAFPGAAGTADMVRRAKAAGIEVILISAPGGWAK